MPLAIFDCLLVSHALVTSHAEAMIIFLCGSKALILILLCSLSFDYSHFFIMVLAYFSLNCKRALHFTGTLHL